MKKLGLLLFFLGVMSHCVTAQEVKKESSIISQNIQQQTIEINDLPDEVKKELRTKYAKYTIEKAVRGKLKGKSVYKVKLGSEDAFQIVLLSNEGKIIASEKSNRRQ